MDSLNITLRQRKLLHLIQNRNQITTGAELARELNVSSRTIRNDVLEINRVLKPYKASIVSVKGKGYSFAAEDPLLIQKMNQIETAFFTSEDRVRYLAFQLCLSDEPINLLDLEDEMFVSHTTLEHDLHALKIKYMLASPRIRIYTGGNTVWFEPDERKKRLLLNRLFHEDWNYDNRGNAYYDYQFLDANVLNYIMDEVPIHLNHYNIQMEDASLVALNLSLAIMYQRCLLGHTIYTESPLAPDDPDAYQATDSIIDTMESKLGCSFSRSERDSIYLQITSRRLMDASKLSFQTAAQYFSSVTLDMGQELIERIMEFFFIDLRNDEDFYITLLQFIHYLQTPDPLFNTQENLSIAKEALQIEYELSWLFQPIALKHMNRYLDETELLHMAHCFSGALEFFYRNHPEKKLRTVICCHLHLSEIWALKRKVMGAFDNYINITDLIPVNAKSAFDFSNTDLVLSTVRKPITLSPDTDTIRISPLMTPSDYRNIEAYIQTERILRYYSHPSITWESLIGHARWYDQMNFHDRFSLISFMAEDFVREGLVSEKYAEDILRRESISSFAFQPGILLIYSHIPSQETQCSIVILKHRINWNSFRIRTVIMAAFRTEDLPFLFLIKSKISSYNQLTDIVNTARKQDDFIRLFSS